MGPRPPPPLDYDQIRAGFDPDARNAALARPARRSAGDAGLPAVVALSRDAATAANLGKDMRRINVGIIGTGWCGGIRANACAANPLVDGLYIAEINPARLAEVAAATNPRKATTEWRELLDIKE